MTTWQGWTPELDDAWRTVAWWHRNRPETEIGYAIVDGPVGPALIQLGRPSRFVPEHVKEARRLLGFPRIHRDQGERP